jgi:hypothetical protein
VDHMGSAEGEHCEESLLHLQRQAKKLGSENGAPPGPQDGANAAFLVDSDGPVRSPPAR